MAIYYHAPEFGIRQTTMRTELAGAMIADGYARISGKVGVVGGMGGPGAALFVAGLIEAKNASVPVVAIVEDAARPDTDKNAVEEVNHQQLFAECAKWVRRVQSAERVDDYVDQAFRAAASGRPGPAVLCVPRDLQFAAAAAVGERSERAGTYPLDRVVADPERVAEAATMLAAARRPLMVCGGGVHLSGAHAEVAALQDLIGIPVATTFQGKGAVDESHPLSIGVATYAMGRNARARHAKPLLDEADLVLLVGTRTGEQATNAWTLYPREARYIHIDLDGQEVGRNYGAFRLVGDARLTLRALTDALRRARPIESERRGVAERAIAAARAAHEKDTQALRDSASRPIRPERLMAEIDARLTDDTVVVADASFATIWMATYLTSRRPGMRFISPRGLGGLGWGLPAAIGAALAAPDSPVVCIAGDGGFGYVWSELETLTRCRLPVTLVILNNQRLGFQVIAEDKTMGGHSPGAEFRPVDHAAMARSAGCAGLRIEDPAEIGPALQTALASRAPVLLDVIIDPEAVPPIGSLE